MMHIIGETEVAGDTGSIVAKVENWRNCETAKVERLREERKKLKQKLERNLEENTRIRLELEMNLRALEQRKLSSLIAKDASEILF